MGRPTAILSRFVVFLIHNALCCLIHHTTSTSISFFFFPFIVIQNCKRKLNEPKNGAVACDYWLGGKFCQMLCKSGFDVRPGYQFSDMIVCGDSGKWLPTGALPLPDCAGKFKVTFKNLFNM